MHVWRFIPLVLAGCATGTLRVGAVMVGDRPSFQASVEFGTAIGHTHSVQLTEETGLEADQAARVMGAFDVDYVMATDDGPFMRIGPRIRGSGASAAFELRSTVFSGLFRDAKTGSGGLGLEFAGGFGALGDVGHPSERIEPAFEAAIVMHTRWPLD